MFKNFTPFRYSGPALLPSLSLPAFVPCAPSQDVSVGFVPHETHLIVRIERKSVPAQAVQRRVDELADQIERETGRRPGRKVRAELKEQAYAELLPRAFPKQSDVRVTFLHERGLLLIGSTTSADVDAVTTLLVSCQADLLVSLLITQQNPQSALASWLMSFEPPPPFAIGRSVTLDSEAGRVKYDKHTLDSENVRDHIRAGKVVESLALVCADRVSFTLTAGLQFKGVELDDQVFEDGTPEDEAAELFLWRTELGALLVDLIDELGGVQS